MIIGFRTAALKMDRLFLASGCSFHKQQVDVISEHKDVKYNEVYLLGT